MNKSKLESLSIKTSPWLNEAKARQRKNKRWGILWKPMIRTLIKYYRTRRVFRGIFKKSKASRNNN
jgi:hypothetical protein